MKSSNLHKTVMKRVYYSYALSFISQVVFWQGMFLGASVLLMGQWLHVASIISNFLATPVGRAPNYVFDAVWGALVGGEELVVVLLVLMIVALFSAGYRIAKNLLPSLVTPRMV